MISEVIDHFPSKVGQFGQNIATVCISKDLFWLGGFPNPTCYTEGWKPFGRTREKARVAYLAERRNKAVKMALETFPDVTDILMVDSYYVGQLGMIWQLIRRYDTWREQRRLVLGASTWILKKMGIRPYTDFWDKWTTPEIKQTHFNEIGRRYVNAVGSCYLFPRSLWEKWSYAVPDKWTPDYGCEHNWLCECARREENMQVMISLDVKLWREPIVYPYWKRILRSARDIAHIPYHPYKPKADANG